MTMIKKIAIALGFLFALTTSSFAATCAVSSVQVKGNDNTVVQMAVTDDGTGSGACIPVASSYLFNPMTVTWNKATGINVGTAGTAGTDVVSVQFPVGGLPFVVTQPTGSNLHFVCDSGCSGGGGSGFSTVDGGAFTAGTSLFAGTGGFFQTTATANPLTNGQQGMWQMTATRAGFVNLRNAAGTEVGTAGAPLQVSLANTGANATPALVTGTGGTFPITAAALPLPTGAATSANQATAAAQASTTAGQTGPIVQCAVTTAAPAYTTAQTDPVSCDTAGNVRVSVSNTNANGQALMAASSPVVFASNQSALPVTGTFWQTTQPISAATLPLMTGAATSANQPTAAAPASTTSGQTGVLAECGVTTAAPTYTTAQTNPLSCDTAGNTRVTVAGKTTEVCVTPTVTASAYTTGNVVGGKITLANAFGSLGTGILQSVRLTFKSVQTAEFDAYEFSANPTGSTWTDKAAPAIVAADALLAKPPIKLFNQASGLGTHTVYGADAIARAVSEGGTSDYFIITTIGTPTPASTTDMQFCASYLQD
jgi:hypothetical protein